MYPEQLENRKKEVEQADKAVEDYLEQKILDVMNRRTVE